MRTDIGRKVQALRRSRDITLPQLARNAEVSKGYLYQLEEGQTGNPSIDVLYKLAGALDLTVADLLGEAKTNRKLPDQVPNSLNDFIRQKKREKDPLSEPEVQMLAGIELRGRRPSTAKDWEYIFESIKMRIEPT
ncbi:MAG: helix-turn-helix domain-containing protein [Planctomycetota bacterium]|jgi:transcriptional regulator with XRE-family HTH domain|nr:helix-turn-helix domain-containing protein [Planctomycetota bacterium]